MQNYINGCSQKPGCQGTPTHIYKPQGGKAVAFCVACMPVFLRSQIKNLQTTTAYEETLDQLYATLAVSNAEEEPKKPRRTRKKKIEEPVEEPAPAPQDDDAVLDDVAEPAAEEPAEETPSE